VQPPAVEVPAEVARHIAGRHALRDHLLVQAGKQLLENLLAAGQQGVRVPAVRHPPARTVGAGELITVNH